MLLACLLLACQKEDGITPGTGFENLYTIQDDPNDSIQHKRYELYTTYGVPVFFNDTIGKVFVKTDVNGDSVFRYETLDLNWAFSGTNSGSVTYQVTRLTDPGLMMKSLRFAEIFLKNSQQALYPYALWLTEKCYQLSSAGVEQKEIISRSEEHTSELQSRSDLVCRLLLFLDKSDKRRGYAGKSRRLPE